MRSSFLQNKYHILPVYLLIQRIILFLVYLKWQKTIGNVIQWQLTLNIERNSIDLLNQIITDIQNLIPSTKRDMEKKEEALEELNKINRSADKRKEAKKNIKRILEAAEELSESSIDTSTIRLKLDELLKIWQKKWSLLPDHKGRDEDYDDDKDDDDDDKYSMMDSVNAR